MNVKLWKRNFVRSHEFVKESINYIGNTPSFGESLFCMSDNEYNSIKKSDWNLKPEALDYLSKDI